jgi:hypothetical protein
LQDTAELEAPVTTSAIYTDSNYTASVEIIEKPTATCAPPKRKRGRPKREERGKDGVYNKRPNDLLVSSEDDEFDVSMYREPPLKKPDVSTTVKARKKKPQAIEVTDDDDDDNDNIPQFEPLKDIPFEVLFKGKHLVQDVFDGEDYEAAVKTWCIMTGAKTDPLHMPFFAYRTADMKKAVPTIVIRTALAFRSLIAHINKVEEEIHIAIHSSKKSKKPQSLLPLFIELVNTEDVCEILI